MVLVFLALIFGGFIAGLFDSVVGGGGVITLPTLLWTGMPPYFALGTNKLAGTFASSTSSFTYLRSQNLYFPLLRWMIPFTFIGALIGANTVLQVNETYLKLIIFIAIVLITTITLWKRHLGASNTFRGLTGKRIVLAIVVAFGLGFYDGFVGPGTGSFLLFAFLSLFRFDFLSAAGNGRVLNFTSNVAALLLFATRGKVMYMFGLPMGFAMMLGARVGSRMAIKRGARLIRPLFIAAAVVLSIKMAVSIF
ncbi:TSUP family transporter [Sulfoacidibacillus thermotolerans]|uniref:Probable membrane transporter protein n=1 Tax=Sulfoacidibacillus thermotolerans TaxID=1765684 RepID=A0A2U3DA40_SULT2|nr:TSUP family transporter [Sulfoacidibacillus thermotolerans]PWI58135.1 hypothetical protein BM613_05175 [Sulfoacidibacillus thermotolerans]